jgi:hypothetical protein
LTLQRCVVPVTLATLSDRRSALSVLELLAQSSSAAAPSDAAAATWLLDPNADEERVADGVATFIVDPARQTIVFSSLVRLPLSLPLSLPPSLPPPVPLLTPPVSRLCRTRRVSRPRRRPSCAPRR